MTPDEDCERILAEFSADFRAKYRRGQAEHGGELWEKTGMIDRAIDEVNDFVAYLYTLRRQLQHLTVPPVSALQAADAGDRDVPPDDSRSGPDGFSGVELPRVRGQGDSCD